PTKKCGFQHDHIELFVDECVSYWSRYSMEPVIVFGRMSQKEECVLQRCPANIINRVEAMKNQNFHGLYKGGGEGATSCGRFFVIIVVPAAEKNPMSSQ